LSYVLDLKKQYKTKAKTKTKTKIKEMCYFHLTIVIS